jgi:hypothetical protein
MQVRTSLGCLLTRRSGRFTTSVKTMSRSPLGNVRTSAGAESLPRSITSFRSITATLMQRA